MSDQPNQELIAWLTSLKELDQTKIINAKSQALLDELSSSDLNIEKVSELLSAEPMLCAKILMIANSPFFGFAREIERIEEAIVIIGGKTLKSLIYTGTLLTSTSNRAVLPYIKHSLTTALFSRAIAELIGMDEDNAYLAGLLHLLPVISNYHEKLEGHLSEQLLQKASSILLVKIGLPASICHTISNLFERHPDNDHTMLLKIAYTMSIIISVESSPFKKISNIEPELVSLEIDSMDLAKLCERVESEQNSIFRLLG
ncbi:HDOD domain-containing protein [Reinekea sp.]|jgi:HD-like signal output (HDOD) protein|uniref:HDOD domain-containing protein n=1 Tax=Reinekea sp. TaxID=1970455 RepID=UPI00398A3397